MDVSYYGMMKSSVVAAGLQCSITSRWLQQHQTLMKKPGPSLGGHTTNHPLFPMLGTCSRDASEVLNLLIAIVFCSSPTC